jgi:hypothetical protein
MLCGGVWVKFKVLPKVDGFKFKGIRYLPGEIVDLPASYEVNVSAALEP